MITIPEPPFVALPGNEPFPPPAPPPPVFGIPGVAGVLDVCEAFPPPPKNTFWNPFPIHAIPEFRKYLGPEETATVRKTVPFLKYLIFVPSYVSTNTVDVV